MPELVLYCMQSRRLFILQLVLPNFLLKLRSFFFFPNTQVHFTCFIVLCNRCNRYANVVLKCVYLRKYIKSIFLASFHTCTSYVFVMRAWSTTFICFVSLVREKVKYMHHNVSQRCDGWFINHPTVRSITINVDV